MVNIYLTPRVDFSDFLANLANKACLVASEWPVNSSQIINGVNCTKLENGDITFAFVQTGIVKKVEDFEKIQFQFDALWETTPQGSDNTITELRGSYSASRLGSQVPRLWLYQKSDTDKGSNKENDSNFSDDRDSDQENDSIGGEAFVDGNSYI